MKETAKLVKAVRKSLRLTQAELGQMLGKDRTTVAHYERGTITVPGDVVLKMQNILKSKKRRHRAER